MEEGKISVSCYVSEASGLPNRIYLGSFKQERTSVPGLSILRLPLELLVVHKMRKRKYQLG